MAIRDNGLVEHFATEEKPFHFTDSGLDNVYLVGIRYFEHPDGTFTAEIPAIKQLLHLIARDIVFADAKLPGSELRFLRKRLGLKSTDTAVLLSVDTATLSRIETGKQDTSPQLSKLMKLAYILLCEDCQLNEEKQQLIKLIRETMKERVSERIVMSVSSENEWSELPVAA
jgi:transcriptional regulator with XRE-family HTH domain